MKPSEGNELPKLEHTCVSSAQLSGHESSYKAALALIKTLQAAGILANITEGGVAIHFAAEQVPKLAEVLRGLGITHTSEQTVLGQHLQEQRQHGSLEKAAGANPFGVGATILKLLSEGQN